MLNLMCHRPTLLACALIAMQLSGTVSGDKTEASQKSIDAAMAAAAASADGLDANGKYDERMASIRLLEDDKLRRLLEKHGVAAPADADSKTLSRLVYHFRGITLETLQGKKQKRQANGEHSVEEMTQLIFDNLDADKSGKLSLAEMTPMLEIVTKNANDMQMESGTPEQIYAGIDADHNGVVDRFEADIFMRMVSGMQNGANQKTGSGRLDPKLRKSTRHDAKHEL